MTIDLGGLDLDLTYEDGLRLSELLGTRAELAYGLDHIWMHSMSAIVSFMVVVLVSWVFIAATLYMAKLDTVYGERVYEDSAGYPDFKPKFKLLYRSEVKQDHQTYGFLGGERKWYKQTEYTLSPLRILAVTFLPMLIPIIAGIVLIPMWFEYDLSGQLAGVDAQIEELISRYT